MSAIQIHFDSTFKALTGYPPFPWQHALYERFVSDRTDDIPATYKISTGLGKHLSSQFRALAAFPRREDFESIDGCSAFGGTFNGEARIIASNFIVADYNCFATR
jgi:hypothetical protein